MTDLNQLQPIIENFFRQSEDYFDRRKVWEISKQGKTLDFSDAPALIRFKFLSDLVKHWRGTYLGFPFGKKQSHHDYLSNETVDDYKISLYSCDCCSHTIGAKTIIKIFDSVEAFQVAVYSGGGDVDISGVRQTGIKTSVWMSDIKSILQNNSSGEIEKKSIETLEKVMSKMA